MNDTDTLNAIAYPDRIRGKDSSTIGAMTKRCKIEKIENGFVYATIERNEYMIPICRIDYIIRNVKDDDARVILGKEHIL